MNTTPELITEAHIRRTKLKEEAKAGDDVLSRCIIAQGFFMLF